jgi:hypothetical protein
LKLKNLYYFPYIFLLVFLPLICVKSQDTIRTDSTHTILITSDTVVRFTDTITISGAPVIDSLKPKHSPTKAALFSAICPGLGQIYNKKYWKLPIVYAGLGISGYYLVRNQKLYKDYKNAFVEYENDRNNPKSQQTIDDINKLEKIRAANDKEGALKFFMDTYRNWRDWSIFSVSLIYLLNIVDATVDAYFFYYDISDDLSFRIKPTIINNTTCYGVLGLQISFNIHNHK